MSSPETLVLRHMADVGWLSISGELFGIGPVASKHSRYFPIGRGNLQQPFPSTRPPPKEVWHQSLLPFFGKCCRLLQDFLGICLCCNFPLQHPPRDTRDNISLEMLSMFPKLVQNSCTAPGPMVLQGTLISITLPHATAFLFQS